MRLILGVVGENAEPLGRDAKKAFGPEGGSLGRGINCNWQLPDPTNTLSAHHAVIGFNGVGFTITDTSTNGVYINTVDVPVGRGNTAPLADGDTLYLASYIISVSIEHDAVEERQKLGLTGSNAVRVGGAAQGSRLATPQDDLIPTHPAAGLLGAQAAAPADPLAAIGGRPPVGLSPAAQRPPQAGAPPVRDPLRMFEEEARVRDAVTVEQDLLAGLAPPRPSSAVIPEAPLLHVPPGQFPPMPTPPAQTPPVPQPPISAGGPAPAPSAIIPDHLDFSDLLPGAAPRATPAPQIPPVQIAPAIEAPIMPPPAARKPLGPALANDLVALRPAGAAAPLPGERVLDPLAVLKERAAQRPVSAPEPRGAVPAAAALPSVAFSASSDELQDFWNALGIDSSLVPPERRRDVLAELGRALAETANGLHSVLAARAMVKNEFHIEQTRIRSGDNNAFKFMKSGQDALRKSLARDHGFLPLARSVREGFHDIKAHEVAAMMAMRAAVSNVLTRMSPQRLETDGASSGLFSGRVDKSKLWDRFVELHTSMVDDIDRTTRAYIAEEFTRSYESHVSALRQGEGTAT